MSFCVPFLCMCLCLKYLFEQCQDVIFLFFVCLFFECCFVLCMFLCFKYHLRNDCILSRFVFVLLCTFCIVLFNMNDQSFEISTDHFSDFGIFFLFFLLILVVFMILHVFLQNFVKNFKIFQTFFEG